MPAWQMRDGQLPRIYFAGPDVFRPNLAEWRIAVKSACCELGVLPLLPCDNETTDPKGIVAGNLRMLESADAVLANLDPFRGVEPDSGTVFEAAYAHASGRLVVGYMSSRETVVERVNRIQGLSAATRDRDGYAIEGFGRVANLMLAESFPIIVGGVREGMQALLMMLTRREVSNVR
jgi:nucleoside 2-deoxyribosyltransferase